MCFSRSINWCCNIRRYYHSINSWRKILTPYTWPLWMEHHCHCIKLLLPLWISWPKRLHLFLVGIFWKKTVSVPKPTSNAPPEQGDVCSWTAVSNAIENAISFVGSNMAKKKDSVTRWRAKNVSEFLFRKLQLRVRQIHIAWHVLNLFGYNCGVFIGRERLLQWNNSTERATPTFPQTRLHVNKDDLQRFSAAIDSVSSF